MIDDSIRQWNPWWIEKEAVKKLSGTDRLITRNILKVMNLRHIKDIIGVRRSGKTTVMYQIVNYLISKGMVPDQIAFINFDDPEIIAFDFEEIEKSLIRINPEIKFLFIDEVQQKKGWERWVRILYDRRQFEQIFVSGSSASLLSYDIGRVLTGRHLTQAVYPFSFKEYLKFIGWKRFDENFLKFHKNKLLYHQRQYIRHGGFPETIEKKDIEREMILTNIFNDILSRDIAARFGADIEGLRRLSYHLMTNVANEFSYRSIARSSNLSVETAEKYLEYLKESFMMLSLDFFSYKTKIQFKQNKKIYSIDTGLRNSVSFRFSADTGRLAENVVLIELKRRGKDVYYWKSQKGIEVDFIVKKGLNVKELIQICWDPKGETLKREIKGLLNAMEEFKLRRGLIITEDKDSDKIIKGKKITFIPLWKWLLIKA